MREIAISQPSGSNLPDGPVHSFTSYSQKQSLGSGRALLEELPSFGAPQTPGTGCSAASSKAMSSKISSRSSLIGVAISLIGNILISLALNCQKLAHVRLEQQKDEEQGATSNGNQQNRSDAAGESQRLLDGRDDARTYGDGVNGMQRQRTKTNGSVADEEADRLTKDDAMPTEFLKSRLWWLGISLMTLGEFGNFLCV